jgi:Phosphopantetheine attachment site
MCNDRLAFALSRRLAALFGLSGPLPGVDTDVFGHGAGPLAKRQLDSLDLVELAVTVEDELGLRLNQNDLTDVTSIHGLATLVGTRANAGAVANFINRWDPAAQPAQPNPAAASLP